MLTLLLVVLAAPKPADAPASKPALANRAAVFVVSKDGADAAASGTEARLTRALEAAKVNLVDLETVFPSAEADGAGEKLLKEAKDAYDNLDYDGAAAKYQSALEHFKDRPASATSQSLGEAYFFTAVIALQNGGKSQAKKAQEAFAKALIFDPNLQADAKTYGADVKKVFDKAANDVSGRPQGTLKIESTPAGAEATLRGKSLGLTPVASGPSVPSGRHLVAFSRAGYEPAAVFVDVKGEGATADGTLKIVQAYGEVRDVATSLVAAGVGSGKVPSGARKLGEVVKSRFLVVANVGESGEGALEVWDVETGSQVSGLKLSDDASLSAAAKKVKDFTANPSPLKAHVASAEPSGGSVSGNLFNTDGPIYQHWWFWAAVGVVVVGGTATAVGVAAAPHPQPYNPVLGF